MADSHHSKPAEIVLADYGWISGPMPGIEEVRADAVNRGDRVCHEGRILVVTEQPVSGWYWEDGERVHGLEIACRALGSRRFLYRAHDETVQRVRPLGGES